MVKIYEAPYAGWDKCLFIENDHVQLVATLEVGPRIIRYSLIGGENMFCEKEGQVGTSGGDEWKIYGGHRVWHSPEASPRSYPADNFPIDYSIKDNVVTLTPPAEDFSRTQKEMVITLSEDSPRVTVEHRITNTGAWDVDLAVWALTVTANGGLEVIPEPEHFQALLPNRRISLWPYSHINDTRVYWGDKFITLKSDPANEKPFKLGVDNPCGWAGIFNKDCLFIKRYPVEPEAMYPDFGVSFETYICDYMTECETLSPLMHLAPGDMAVHVEEWELHREKMPDASDEDAIEEIFNKYI